MGHRTFVQQKMGHERKKVENHCSGQITLLRNFTGSKFVLVTSQLCLLWFVFLHVIRFLFLFDLTIVFTVVWCEFLHVM